MVKIITFALLLSSSILQAVTWTYTEIDSSATQLAVGYPIPLPIDQLTAGAGFRSYDFLHAQHQDLMLSSNLITGTITGTTTYGRDIWAYSLSDADNTTSEGMILEGAVLQNGGIHAREWSTPEVTTGLMERLISNEADEWLYQYLLENLNIVIHPVENVDGFLQTQRYPNMTTQSSWSQDSSDYPRDGRMRRKNMLNVDENLETLGDSLLGIDLNRNNAPFWNTSSRSSPNVNSIVYHGNSAASEPETQSLQAAAALGPSNRLRFYIDTHSFSRLWFVPYTTNERRNNIAMDLANKMRRATRNLYDISPSASDTGIGSTDEYFANTYNIPSYTLETEPNSTGSVQYGGNGVSHSGFILPAAEITRVRTELADASSIAWYMQAGPAAMIAVEITDTDSNTLVYSGQWDVTSTTERQWNETVNTGLVSAGNYKIWAAYNKPMRWIDEQGIIINYASTNILLSPQVSIEGLDSSNAAFNQLIQGNPADWLTTAGGPSVGYLNYKSDAFMVYFTLDANIDPASSTLLALAFANEDFAEKINDANPATVVDWNSNWINYEDSLGASADNGGVDRTIRLIDDGSAGFTDPASSSSGGGGGNPNPPASGGGGGVIGFTLFLLLLSACIITGYRRSKFRI
jgi:hypothetical protein